MSPCTKNEILEIISSLDHHKAIGINSISIKITKLAKILYQKQLGFQNKFSTAKAVISLIENNEKAIDNKVLICGVFLDFQKAFDTVDHEILLHKHPHYGKRDTANCWFSFYFSNRKQFVEINGFDPETQRFQCGVPQGSVMGPLLF